MNRITSIFTGFSFAILFFVASAHAQYDGQRMAANIPFEFSVGSLSFPAGQYVFIRSGASLVQVRDDNGHGLFTMSSASIQENGMPGKSRLKFAVVDGRHLLTQIWNQSAASGYEFSYEHDSVELTKH